MRDRSRWIVVPTMLALACGADRAGAQTLRPGAGPPRATAEEPPRENLPPGIVAETFDTRVEGHRDLKFYLRKPRRGAVAATGVLAICTVGERRISMDLTERSPHFAHLLALADRHALAVIAFGQPATGGAWDRRVSTQDLDAAAAARLDRIFDALAREWARLITRFAHKYSLPERGYLLYGICGGAQYAHRLALRQPQLFRAVHAHYGGSYDVPTRDGRALLWLITTYEDDAGHLPAQRFYAACVQAGYRMILKAYPRGGAGDAINRLSERFFEHALSAAGAGEARPQYIGDHVNNVVLPVAEAGWIPREQAVPLPTRELAKAWEGAPD